MPLSIARRIAAEHPEAALPCPACAASLKARNLDRHLGEVHGLAAFPEPPRSLHVELAGVDRRVFWVCLLPPLLLAAGVACLALLGVALDDGPAPALLAVLLVGAFLPLLLAELGYLRARLVLDERHVELSYAFGLLRAEVALPAVIETGSVWQRKPSGIMPAYEHSPAEDTRVGSYLRLESGGRAVTIATKGGTALRKHWAAPFRSGPRRRHPDIVLDRAAHVALEYHLASLGLLRPA